MIGSGTENWLNGWGGNDVIFWIWRRRDTISGGEGDDQLRGDGGTSGLGHLAMTNSTAREYDDYLNGAAALIISTAATASIAFPSTIAPQRKRRLRVLLLKTITNDGRQRREHVLGRG
ncbi:MAG: hypothetical protein IPL62_18010 [Caulobacteraceae bacterium]|nr:hypothetical protein [Caulobacteraceae bacterium]